MDSRSHWQSKHFGLTYSRCNLPKDLLKIFLHSKFDDKLQYLCISSELHEDGYPHIHAQIQFKARFKASKSTFDFSGFHPSIECLKDPSKWNTYIKKEDLSPIEWGELTFSSSAVKKPKLTNKELLEIDPIQLVNEEKISLYSLPGLLNAKRLYDSLSVIQKPDLPPILPPKWKDLDIIINPNEKKRHYWFWSQDSNKGKTTHAKFLIENYRGCRMSLAEKYQSQINASAQLIIIEEIKKGNSLPYTTLDLMCDGTYQYPVKGGTAVTPKDPYIFIYSNFPIDAVYLDQDGVTRLRARFNEICLDYYDFYS